MNKACLVAPVIHDLAGYAGAPDGEQLQDSALVDLALVEENRRCVVHSAHRGIEALDGAH